MKNEEINKLYDKIRILERNKMDYLEANCKAEARRIAKQIEKVYLQIQLFELDKVKRELFIYKKVIREYPNLQLRIKNELLEQKNNMKR